MAAWKNRYIEIEARPPPIAVGRASLTPSFRSIHFRITLRSAPADRELAEADPELHARPAAGQRQRNLALGQGLRL